MSFRVLLCLAAALVVAGCASPEKRASRAACAAEWASRIPPEYETRVVTRHRVEEVPDGTETCTVETVLDTTTPNRRRYKTVETCTPNTHEREVAYEVERTVDLRSAERNALVRDCVAKRCMASHGNVSCK